MSLKSFTLPGLYNGVSQQPPSLRLDNQVEVMENIFPDLVDGAVKRHGTEITTYLTNSNINENIYVHPINRDPSERYIVIVTDDATAPLEIYTENGTKCTVLYPDVNVKSYLTKGSNPKANLSMVTIADYTIITNSCVTCLSDESTSNTTPPAPMSLVHVKKGLPEIKYTVKVKTLSGSILANVSYTSPAPSKNGVTTTQTDKIAEHLVSLLSSELGSGWTIAKMGSTLVVEHTGNNTEFVVTTSDSYGDRALVPINHSIQKFTDLPPQAPDGYMIEVAGDDKSAFDNFYVEYDGNESVWKESRKKFDDNGVFIDDTFAVCTVPVRLIRSGENEFTLTSIEWESRTVGDEDSAPMPSFVDSSIDEVFFYKNRLGFLSGENIVLSKVNDFFNFFPCTATDVLDDDPIDIAVATKKVSKMKHTTPFANNLLLFSDQQQFILSSGGQGALTPTSIAVDQATEFTVNTNVTPVGIGSNVYFCSEQGNYSSIWEYYVQPDTVINDAQEVTGHVPKYIPKNVKQIVGSTHNSSLFVLSEDDSNSLYVYKFYWEGQEKQQSAWAKWVLPGHITIYGLVIIAGSLHLVCKRELNSTVEYLMLSFNLGENVSKGLNFHIYLDEKENVKGVYDSQQGKTIFTLAGQIYTTDIRAVSLLDGLPLLGLEQTGNNTFEIDGDYSAGQICIGYPFKYLIQLSQIYPKDSQGLSDIISKFTIRNLYLTFVNSGDFKVKVTPFNRETSIYEYTGIILGQSLFGEVPITSGEHIFNVSSSSKDVKIEIESESYLPLQIQMAGYEVEHVRR